MAASMGATKYLILIEDFGVEIKNAALLIF
jgi:hypothetical protein